MSLIYLTRYGPPKRPILQYHLSLTLQVRQQLREGSSYPVVPDMRTITDGRTDYSKWKVDQLINRVLELEKELRPEDLELVLSLHPAMPSTSLITF